MITHCKQRWILDVNQLRALGGVESYFFFLISEQAMSVAVLLCLIIFSTGVLGSEDEYLNQMLAKETRITFKLWQLNHQKSYPDITEEELRFQIFQKNKLTIADLNQQHGSEAEFELNEFADMTAEEFRRTRLMPRRSPPQHEQDKFMSQSKRADPLPESYDWRDHGRVTSVKNQGSAGTCWAFSTVANIEGQYERYYNKLIDLSVEQVVDCDDSKDISKDYADCGVYGGWPYLAYGYIQRQGGLESEQDYSYCCGIDKNACEVCPFGLWNNTLCGPPQPYCNMTQSCPYKLNKSKFVSNLTLSGWNAINSNETEIAKQLIDIGPLSIALDASMLQFYKSGVFNPFFCSKTQLDHAVLLVGWGTQKGIFGSTPYWTIKNSWGPTWGEKGYFRIKRGAGVCGMNTQVTTALLKH